MAEEQGSLRRWRSPEAGRGVEDGDDSGAYAMRWRQIGAVLETSDSEQRLGCGEAAGADRSGTEQATVTAAQAGPRWLKRGDGDRGARP